MVPEDKVAAAAVAAGDAVGETHSDRDTRAVGSAETGGKPQTSMAERGSASVHPPSGSSAGGPIRPAVQTKPEGAESAIPAQNAGLGLAPGVFPGVAAMMMPQAGAIPAIPILTPTGFVTASMAASSAAASSGMAVDGVVAAGSVAAAGAGTPAPANPAAAPASTTGMMGTMVPGFVAPGGAMPAGMVTVGQCVVMAYVVMAYAVMALCSYAPM